MEMTPNDKVTPLGVTTSQAPSSQDPKKIDGHGTVVYVKASSIWPKYIQRGIKRSEHEHDHHLGRVLEATTISTASAWSHVCLGGW